MNDIQNNDLQVEWSLLQNQFDSYEKHSLYIKLISILCLFVALLHDTACLALLMVVLLWGQDTIWKTFQSRIDARLVMLEKAIGGETELLPFQFNRDFEKSRGGLFSLLSEYLKNSLRPTVAFPHAILVLFAFYWAW